ncbi:MAG TPA: hypothetical protein PKN52_05575, partial [Trueperaceae bacterium]|nr:hypothetical protein [Trueperaceae bacterium]
LMHVSHLVDDYYLYIEDQLMLMGKHTRKRYRMGDRVEVKILAANPTQRQIDLLPADLPMPEVEEEKQADTRPPGKLKTPQQGAAEGVVATSGSTKGASAKGAPAKNGSAKGGSAKSGSADGGSAGSGPAKGARSDGRGAPAGRKAAGPRRVPPRRHQRPSLPPRLRQSRPQRRPRRDRRPRRNAR